MIKRFISYETFTSYETINSNEIFNHNNICLAWNIYPNKTFTLLVQNRMNQKNYDLSHSELIILFNSKLCFKLVEHLFIWELPIHQYETFTHISIYLNPNWLKLKINFYKWSFKVLNILFHFKLIEHFILFKIIQNSTFNLSFILYETFIS